MELDLSHCSRISDKGLAAIGHRAGAGALRDLSLHGLFQISDQVRFLIMYASVVTCLF